VSHGGNLEALKSLPLYKLSGYYGNDTMSPIMEMTYSNAMKSAANSYLAAEMASKEQYKVIYALNSSPGHHASLNGGYSGYCFINNGAVVAKRFQELGFKHICILDLDYHAGNGTQDIFYQDPTVLTISIHMNPILDYPSFIGFEDEEGLNDGSGYNLNLCLNKGANWDEYSKKLNLALTDILNFRPDALIIAFGCDTFYLDPDASKIAGSKLELDDYIKMGEMINESIKDIPIVVTQEGGYYLDKVPTMVSSFLLSLAN